MILILAITVIVVGALGDRFDDLAGVETSIVKYPYQVSIEVPTCFGFYHTRHDCSGTIISRNLVLTAAHCLFEDDYTTIIPAKKIKIRAGSSKAHAGGDLHTVSLYHTHEQFNKNNMENDVAVIKVAESFQFNEYVKSVPLSTETPSKDSSFLISGWRRPRYPCLGSKKSMPMKEIRILIREKDECVNGKMFCAMVPEGVEGRCESYEGSPLVLDGKVAGIVSRANSCTTPGNSILFTDVVYVSQWIKSKTGDI